MDCFNNKVAVVTGGSRGIGKAIALKLAEEGIRVVITYYQNAKAAQSVIQEIKEEGKEGFAYQNDSSDFYAVKQLIKKIKKEIGEIDFLVNNAGIGINKSFYLLSEDDWDQVIQTNLKGVFNFCRHILVDFIKRRAGSIVNISSVAGFKGLTGQANYCASKAGIINLTRSLAREVGRTGVRINTVAPGFVNTEMTRGMDPKLIEMYINQIPFQRFGKPEEVAEVVLFLLSKKSNYIQGETIVVDGGLSL